MSPQRGLKHRATSRHPPALIIRELLRTAWNPFRSIAERFGALPPFSELRPGFPGDGGIVSRAEPGSADHGRNFRAPRRGFRTVAGLSRCVAAVCGDSGKLFPSLPPLFGRPPPFFEASGRVRGRLPQIFGGLPQLTRGLPQLTRGVPQLTRGLPHLTRRLPLLTRRVPHLTRGLPQLTRRVPQILEGSPQLTSRLPQLTPRLPKSAPARLNH